MFLYMKVVVISPLLSVPFFEPFGFYLHVFMEYT